VATVHEKNEPEAEPPLLVAETAPIAHEAAYMSIVASTVAVPVLIPEEFAPATWILASPGGCENTAEIDAHNIIMLATLVAGMPAAVRGNMARLLVAAAPDHYDD
jgi:hypothetical protein